MSLVVEDGTAPAGANAYITVDECNTYCTDRGLTFAASPTTLGEQAIVRATAALDGLYRARYPGYKTNFRNQSLEWPRTAAADPFYYPIGTTTIPVEIKQACCEMAVRELADPGSMTPDLERGGAIRALAAGSVSIEYHASSSVVTTFQTINGILAGLLGPAASSFISSASRG